MASSLFGNQNYRSQNNMTNMLESFQKFKQSMNGKDPQTIVKNMLASGQMTQQQYNQLSSMAQQLSSFLK